MSPAVGRRQATTQCFSARTLAFALVVGVVLIAVPPPLSSQDEVAAELAARSSRVGKGASVTIELVTMPAKHQIMGGPTLELFTASADSAFWCGPNKPNPCSWLGPSIICRSLCDFEFVFGTKEGVTIEIIEFGSVEPATYRIRVGEVNRPAPGIYIFRFIYGGEIVDEFRVDIQDLR